MIATIGFDPQVGNTRFMFGQLWLMDGIDFLVLAVALFGVGEVLASVEQALKPPKVELTIRNVLPTYLDWLASRWAIVRGTVIGFLIGVLPGAGATIASFMAYAVEKKISKHPEKFGTRRDRGRRGARSGQQRRCHRRDGADVCAGHPGLGHHCHHAGRADHVRPAAGAAAVSRRTPTWCGASLPACMSVTSFCSC